MSGRGRGVHNPVRKNANHCISVAIIEDDPLRVAGFHAILDRHRDLRTVAVSLPELASAHAIDVVVLQEQQRPFAITIEHAKSQLNEVPILVTTSAATDEIILDTL